MKYICVLAGTYKQFLDFVEQERIDKPEKHKNAHYHYADLPNQLLGKCFDEVVVVGTFWEKSDAGELYRLSLLNDAVLTLMEKPENANKVLKEWEDKVRLDIERGNEQTI